MSTHLVLLGEFVELATPFTVSRTVPPYSSCSIPLARQWAILFPAGSDHGWPLWARRVLEDRRRAGEGVEAVWGEADQFPPGVGGVVVLGIGMYTLSTLGNRLTRAAGPAS
ncbi:hypothetical protein GCM10020367_28700 [Streptomyces sannanensis]|uniref:Uncharacterized protein n=1 Tax=Streptomyces sannanensis TaxID=285536 RepID=A0ABP6SB86_9ACTN